MSMSMKYLENICQPNEVNGFKLNNNSTILLDGSVDLTKYFSINEKITTDFDKANNKSVNKFKQDLKIHLDNIYSFLDILYQIKFFNDEFHKGRSIKNIANYIFKDNDEKFLDNAYFLLDLIGKFILLCKYKAIHISEMANHEVKKEYNKLSTDFRKFERYFYTHIYQPSENYDKEFLDGMSNLLVR